MRRRSQAVAVMVLLCCSVPLAAQTGGGSSYSIFNLGDIRIGTSAAGIGRGGTEGVIPTTRLVNTLNPAFWGDLENVTVQAGVLFSQHKVSDATGSVSQNRTALADFAVGFPLSKSLHAGLAAGLHPYSTVSYRTRLTSRAPTAAGDSVGALMEFSGSGGISEAFLGGSIAPIPEVTIGAAATHYFGAIDNETGVEFPDAELNSAIYQRNDLLSGWGARFGVAVRPIPALLIAGVFELPITLDRQRYNVSSYRQQRETVVDTADIISSELTVPSRITAGASLRTGRFLLGAQAALQAWDKSVFQTARSSMRIGVGADRLGSTSAGASTIDKWDLRVGAYFDQTYYEVAGNGIDELGLTLGLGIPLTVTTRLDVGTGLDLGIELGRRGTTDAGLTEELFGRVMVQLSVSELWFVRSRR